MRILITSTGDKELKDLPNHQRVTRNFLKENQSMSMKEIVSNSKKPFHSTHHHYQTHNKPHLALLNNTSNLISINIKTPPIKHLKHVKDLYERPQSRNANKHSLIAESMATLPTVNNINYNNTNTNSSQNLYSMKDILSPKTVQSMLQSIKTKERIKERNFKLDNEHFRTIYGSKSELIKAQELLKDPSISPDRNDLIKYLQNKETLNINVMKRIKESKEVDQVKTNKACQILLANSDNDKVFKDNIERRLRKKNSEVKMGFKRKVDQMKSEIDTLNSIVSSHNSPGKNVDAYKEQHFIWDRLYWRKHNFDRLMKRSNANSMSKTRNGMFENNNNNMIKGISVVK